jgi:hypothetical protein
MVLEFKTGTFTRIGTVGTQAITGVGFTPKVIIIYSANDSTANSFTSDAFFHIGCATDTTAANQRSYSVESEDAADPSDCNSAFETQSIYNDSGATLFTDIAHISAISSDGFTLNWTENDGGSAQLVYICLGGSDIVTKSVGQFTAPNTTGDSAITGVGFQPDFVMLIGMGIQADDTPGRNTGYCIGFFNANGEQAVSAALYKHGVATMDTARYQRVDQCLAIFSPIVTTTITHEAAFSSMDGDGFTLNYSTASSSNRRVIYLAIKDINSKIGTFDSPTVGTAPVSQAITGVGFEPRGVIFETVGKTAGTIIVTHARHSLGSANASDSEALVWYGDEDASTTVINAEITNTNACIRVSDEASSAASTTTQALADFTSLDGDGFTISWSVRDASNAYEIIYAALGDAGGEAEGNGKKRKPNITSMIPIGFGPT